jgi:predicted nuclease of predicted toxin-antitoxin system
MRILLDHNVPIGVRFFFAGHEVVAAHERGWQDLANGDLLEAAEADGFEVMLTADRNIKHQQNMSGRRIRLAVLWTNRWTVLRADPQRVVALALGQGRGP